MFLILIALLGIVSFLIWRHRKDRQLLETVTARHRGEWSERKAVLRLLKMGIDPRAIFHDCYKKVKRNIYSG